MNSTLRYRLPSLCSESPRPASMTMAVCKRRPLANRSLYLPYPHIRPHCRLSSCCCSGRTYCPMIFTVSGQHNADSGDFKTLSSLLSWRYCHLLEPPCRRSQHLRSLSLRPRQPYRPTCSIRFLSATATRCPGIFHFMLRRSEQKEPLSDELKMP